MQGIRLLGTMAIAAIAALIAFLPSSIMGQRGLTCWGGPKECHEWEVCVRYGSHPNYYKDCFGLGGVNSNCTTQTPGRDGVYSTHGICVPELVCTRTTDKYLAPIA